MSELTGNRIRTTAGKLGLPHLAETINEYTRRADEAKMGYLDFLDLVLSEELAVRDDRRFSQGLRLSKLPHHKTLDEYDFSFQPELDPRKVKDLASLSFVDGKANAALLGPPGVGKTHIAVALAVAACRAGYSIYFTSLDVLKDGAVCGATVPVMNRRISVSFPRMTATSYAWSSAGSAQNL